MHPPSTSQQAVALVLAAILGGSIAGCGGPADATAAKDVPSTVLQDETRPLPKPASPRKP